MSELINKKSILNQLRGLETSSIKLVLLIGPIGSGKKTTLKYLAKDLNWLYLPFEGKIDAIRGINEIALQYSSDVLVCIEDGNSLTIQAQNALLKIGEEPPKNVHIFICVTDIDIVLPTIRSRAYSITMPSITKEDIQKFYTIYECGDSEKQNNQTIKSLVVAASDTYQDVVELLALDDPLYYFEYCKKVVDNIGKVSTTNAFAILNNLNLRGLKLGYNPLLFLGGIKYQLIEKMYCGGNLGVILWEISLINHCTKLIQENVNPLMVMSHFITETRQYFCINNLEGFDGASNT